MLLLSNVVVSQENQTLIQKLNFTDNLSAIYNHQKNLQKRSPYTYTKKQIILPDTALIQNDISNAPYFDLNEGMQILRENLEVARFYLPIPPTTNKQAFQTMVSTNSSISSEDLKENLEAIYGPYMIDLLKQNLVAQEQALKLVPDNQFSTTKGRSLGITADEIGTVMQTSFFFLPYIDNAYLSVSTDVYHKDDETITETQKKYVIKGGALIYQFSVNPDFSYEFNLIKTIPSTGTSETVIKEGSEGKKYDGILDFIITMIWDIFNPFENVSDPLLHWKSWEKFSSKLSSEILKIDEFILKSKIIETSPEVYEIFLGEDEGLYLDQQFSLMETIVINGDEIEKESGLLMVKDVGKNKNNYSHTSRGVLRYGNPSHLSSWIIEKRKKNIQVNLGLAYLTNISIYKRPLQPSFNLKQPNNEFYYNVSANLARWVNISQLFVVIDGIAGDALSTIYLGFQKKFWYRHNNINATLSLGNVNYTHTDTLSNSFNNVKVSIGYEHLITSYCSFNTAFFYSLPSSPNHSNEASYTYRGIRSSFRFFF